MKRIIKETLDNGDIQYRVETNRCFFGLFKCKWHTDTCIHFYGDIEIRCAAVFNTLREAQIYCGIDPNPVVKRQIIEE